jgi:methylmalonyl-CoA mutase
VGAAKTAAEQGRLDLGGDSVTATINRLIERTELRLGVGTNYFLEIAKLRAARSLVGEILDHFGVTARPKIHAITTSSNKTLYDPYNNLLRGTIEAAAAVIGGVDSLTVAAYDQGYHAPDEFSEHLARNTDNLLLEEAQLGRVADPLGGSYTVEVLTHSIAEAARGVMATIAAAGGIVGASESGWIEAELNRIKSARALQVSTRKRTIVGTTVYPNLKERRLDDVESRPVPRQITGLATADLDGLARTMAAGGDIKHHIGETPCPSTPFDAFRPSWPYEYLRLRTERHGRTGGKVPVIFLAKLGDVTMRQARAAFCLGFFGAAGYQIQEEAFASVDDAAQAAERAGADLLVLCSSDAEYLNLATGLKTTTPVVVAGYPADQVEALKAAGISDFVHLRQDIYLTLEQWHTRFKIPLIPLDEPLNPAPREVTK